MLIYTCQWLQKAFISLHNTLCLTDVTIYGFANAFKHPKAQLFARVCFRTTADAFKQQKLNKVMTLAMCFMSGLCRLSSYRPYLYISLKRVCIRID